MKKSLLIGAAVAGLAVSSFAQGVFNVDNSANYGSGSPSTATTGGLFWLNSGGTTALIQQDFNVQILGSTSLNGTYTPLLTLLLSDGSATGDNFSQLAGVLINPTGDSIGIPGVAVNGTGYVEIEAWLGGNSYATATYAGETSGGFAIANLGGTTTGGTVVFPPDISAMPAVVLVAVPEPATFALAGLGAAALMIFRRRK